MNNLIKAAGHAIRVLDHPHADNTPCTMDKQQHGRCGRKAAHRMAGFSYIELLVATIILTLALIPALDGLSSGIQGSRLHEAHAMDFNHLTAKLEEVLAEPFTNLDAAALAAGDKDTPSSYSDSVTTADGRSLTRQVFLARYDGDNIDDSDPFTGGDAGLIWVKVQLAGTAHAVECLTSLSEP